MKDPLQSPTIASKKTDRSSTDRSCRFLSATARRGERCVATACSRMEKRHFEWQRERMISRSSFIPSCRERALQRNRCQSQHEEYSATRPGVGRRGPALASPPSRSFFPFSRSNLPISSSYIYLPYLFIFLPIRKHS